MFSYANEEKFCDQISTYPWTARALLELIFRPFSLILPHRWLRIALEVDLMLLRHLFQIFLAVHTNRTHVLVFHKVDVSSSLGKIIWNAQNVSFLYHLRGFWGGFAGCSLASTAGLKMARNNCARPRLTLRGKIQHTFSTATSSAVLSTATARNSHFFEVSLLFKGK